jgi:hypothetical protein
MINFIPTQTQAKNQKILTLALAQPIIAQPIPIIIIIIIH